MRYILGALAHCMVVVSSAVRDGRYSTNFWPHKQDMEPKHYDPSVIEPRWQAYWESNKTFATPDDFSKPKFYVLDMFPYPSGSGLHVGHPEGYTATDIVARFKRMNGFNVLHPMGWDAFGLPAEQHAIKTGTHPRDTTAQNIDRFREQLKSLGFGYDWDREVNTTDPNYYKWTQWIFLQLYKKDLAYIAEVPVNWCPALGTVLANEEVIDGRSERGGHPVVRKPMRQWMLKITEYAERLLQDLDLVNWPDSVKEMQRNWIGKSIGAEAIFKVVGDKDRSIKVFTTRPDTLFGATYMVLAPEHPLVDEITTDDQREAINAYREQAAGKSDLQRTDLNKDKTGVFTGGYAINPVNGEKIPVWVADYVLAGYGTGAIMAVPAHDQRDWEFAKTFGLPIIEVIGSQDANLDEAAWTGDGKLVNSGFLNGLSVPDAKDKIAHWLQEQGVGQRTVNYKLRDWLFSRQRYWGEPFPIIFDEEGNHHPLPEQHLPLTLPEVENYKPTGTGDPPLGNATDWVNFNDAETGAAMRRETNTMPQWAGSSWYYLRYIDPHNDQALVDPEKEKYWMPVDLYVGGVEHAVLHLLYARFWHKVLYDIGAVSTPEPFDRLVNQGMILGFSYRYFSAPDKTPVSYKDTVHEGDGVRHKDTGDFLESEYVAIKDVQFKDEVALHPQHEGLELEVLVEKMSKSRGNVVNPDDVVAEYGADSLRLYEMFMGPLEQVKPWNTKGVSGVSRFLSRVWRLVIKTQTGQIHEQITDAKPNDAALRALHRCIKKVTEDTEAMRFNTAIAAMMEYLNALYKLKTVSRELVDPFLLILAPYAPHISEELWSRLGHGDTLANEPWPKYDEALTKEQKMTIVIQVRGKKKGVVEVAPDASKDAILEAAKEAIADQLAGKDIVREIYVPGRLVNLVVK